MKNNALLKKLERLGFALMEPEETFDINEVLVEVVRSHEIRLWEGFPVLVLNAAEKGLFAYDSVSKLLQNNQDRVVFKELLLLSLALYKHRRLKYLWANQLYADQTPKDLDRINVFYKGFQDHQNFLIANFWSMDSERIRNIFNDYLNSSNVKLIDSQISYERLSLEYAQSQIFSPKQKDLFLKKLKGEKLNKTESEYFSRVVKKKLIAIANNELHNLARKILKY